MPVKARRRVRRRKLPEDDDDDMNLYNDMVDDDSSNHMFEQVEQTERSSSSLEALPSPGYIESDSTLGSPLDSDLEFDIDLNRVDSKAHEDDSESQNEEDDSESGESNLEPKEDENNRKLSEIASLSRVYSLVQGTHFNEVKDGTSHKKIQSANTCQFYQVAIREHYRMPKSLLSALHLWINSKFWKKEHVRKASSLKNRLNLYPLMRLYVRHMPATPKYMKRAKVRGYASDELLLNCAFFDICDSIVRDLRLPGRLESCAWTNEALVGPIADGFPHGKCFRSNPLFTFDSILCRGKQRALGQDVSGVTDKGTPFLGKISAIFTHRTSGDDSGSLCMYLQEYKLLSQLGDEQSSAVPDEQPGELVLLENEILFQGTLLNWVLDDITVVDSIPLFNQSSSNRRYLCRFGMEDQHLRPLRNLRRSPADYHDFSQLRARIAEAKNQGLKIVRVALGIGGDFWSSTSGKSISICSLYKFYCNLTWAALQKVENYDCWGQVPKGVDLMAFMLVLEPMIKTLQLGFAADLGPNGKAFIHGGVCIVPADMPQAQQFCGFKSQTATHFDRFSHITQDEGGNLDYNLKENRKTLDHMREAREKQNADPRSAPTLLKEMGMAESKSVFENLAVDPTTVSPPLNDHQVILGQVGKLIKLTLEELTPTGKIQFVKALHRQPLPPSWPPLTAPRLSSAKDAKLMMGIMDLIHVIQIAPMAFAGDFFKLPPRSKGPVQHDGARAIRVTFTDVALEKYRARSDGTDTLLKCYIEMAATVKAVFAKTRSASSSEQDRISLAQLDDIIMRGLRTLQGNWPGEFNTPNITSTRHIPESTGNFGIPAVLSSCMQELMHTLYKHKLSTTSGRNSVVELMQYENFRQASRYMWLLLESGADKAAKDPAVQRLPIGIQRDLFDPANGGLRELLLPRPTKSPYAAHNLTHVDETDFYRPGPEVKGAPHNLSVLEKILLARLSGVAAKELPDIERLGSIILPRRPACEGTLYADISRYGVTHYAVDAAVEDEKLHRGMVQLDHLFMFRDIAYAIVTWGVAKSSDDKQTGCQSYTFEALQSGMVKRAINALRNNTPIPEKAECVLRAERLVKYYHFGHPETTGRLTPFLLNKYFF